MNQEQYRGKHNIFYIVYIVVNVFSFGTPWFLSNLIGYGVAKGSIEKDKKIQY